MPTERDLKASAARVRARRTEQRLWQDHAFATLEAQLYTAERALRRIAAGEPNPVDIAKGALHDVEEMTKDPA